MKRLWTVEGERLKLALHRGQARAWRSKKRFTFIIAGTQSGKTSYGPWWLWREIKKRGGGDYLAVTSSFDLFKLKLLPELRSVFESVLGIGRFWAGEKVIELKDPSTGQFLAKRSSDPMWGRIILRSAQSSGGLESATAKAAWLDECGQDEFTLEDWEAVQRRLSLSEGPALGTTTPYNLGWLKGEVYDPWVEGDPDIEVVNFPSTLNPLFPKREFTRMEAKMQSWRFDMFYRGQFAKPAGLIYGCFTDDMLIDPFPIPLDWPRMVGVDFGGANTATLWMAENPETEQWFVYDETLEGGLTSREHAEKAKDKAEGIEDLEAVGGAKSESQERRDWADGGFWLDAPQINAVEPGIDKVAELMKTNRLRVFRTLKGLRDELGSYRRKLDKATGEPTDDIADKRKFHRLDALRYASVGILTGGWHFG